MKLTATDIQTRVRLANLLVRMDEHPEISKEIGLTDTSHFTEEKENGRIDHIYSVDNRVV